jgi:tripartite-type tricarboxylate transporter receptor subunit TctC
MNAAGSKDAKTFCNMTPRRRDVLQLSLAAGALAALPGAAHAQAPYPSRPVHMLLGFAAGGTSDVIGRMICQWLSEHLGKAFVFDNRTGAASNIA